MKFRPLHRKISIWLALPLLVSAMTGVAYRIGRSWFGMSSQIGGEILSIHSWSWLGKAGSLAVIWVVGCGLLFLCGSAFQMLWSSGRKCCGHRKKIVYGIGLWERFF